MGAGASVNVLVPKDVDRHGDASIGIKSGYSV